MTYFLGTALFLLCAAAHANLDDLNGSFENGCPKDTTVKKLLPHEYCRQYYECHNGELISRICPVGLQFNTELEKCDWNVRCHSKEILANNDSEAMINESKEIPVNNDSEAMINENKETDSEAMMNESKETDFDDLDMDNPRDAAKICQGPNSNGVLVAHEYCNEFYRCVYGKPVNLKCAPDLLYNTMTAKCDWPHNVDCGERLGKESHISLPKTNKESAFPYTAEEIESNSDPNQANSLCSSRNSDGVLVAHENCNRFYKCFAGVPNTVKCPVNLLYNPIKERCDWPRNVDCDGRSIPDNDDRSIPDNDDYSYPVTQGKNNLKEKKDIIRDTKQSINAAVICAAENSEGVSVAHQMCSHFYKCSGNEPVVFSCPGNLLYNLHKNYCDWPRNVVCGDRTLAADTGKDNDNGDLRQAITICSGEGSDGMLLTHELCNLFYECHDGQPIAVTCPPHLYYHPESENCEWPTYVSCKDRKLP